MNNYLTFHAYQNFTIKESYNKFPNLTYKEGVMYMSNSELIYYLEEKFIDCVIIYDEIDRWFLDYIAHISNVNGKSVLKYPPLILKKFKCVICFTGTLSDSTVKQI
jgi:hypothetical protein